MRKENRSKKKKFIGLIFGFFERENVELIILGILAFLISIFGHAIYSTHSQYQSEFDKLSLYVRDLSYIDENLYDDCNNKMDTNEILTDVNSLRTKLYALIDQGAAMGNLMSRETYCAIHQFQAWNDQLMDAGEAVCEVQLKSEAEIEDWRNQILKQIEKNKLDRQGPISSLKEYFTNIEENTHTPSQCK